MQDSDILEVGKSEDPRLLRLRADLREASMATMKGIVAAESKQKDVAISNQAEDLAIARSEIQIERLREACITVSRPREA